MPIITVSRGTYSGGKELAECVAARIKAPCISREILVQAAGKFGVSEQVLAEAMARPPSVMERFSHQRDAYLAFVRSVLLEHAAAGSFVYHGHAGHLLLADIVNVIRVRIVAPMSFRVPAAMKRLGLDERQARAHIERVDREREKWTRYLYHSSWQDPSLYDAVLNLGQLDLSDACEIVATMAGLQRFQWTEASRRAVADKALASLVTAELAKNDLTRGSRLEVSAHAGVVYVRGSTGLREVRDAVPHLVRAVPGVTEVHSEVSLQSDVVPD
jgi:cytidylate kinase